MRSVDYCLLFSCALSACATASGQVPARAERPRCEVLLRDGQLLAADELTTAADGSLQVRSRDGERRAAAADVVAVLGCSVQDSVLPTAALAGGDLLRGLLVGGDASGDHFELQSPVLGRLRLPVDRLECLVLRPDRAAPRDLVLPQGADEALFREAALGFDRLVGTMHQLGERGVRFQPNGQDQPRWYDVHDLVGVRLGGGVPPAKPAPAQLCTRVGDRLGVRDVAFAGTRFRAQLEGGVAVDLPLADVACVVLLERDVILMSAATPTRADEAGFDSDVLLPWQRDRAVTGGPLLAAGRCYALGFGVHSRSRLEFEVPAGAAAFVARVGFDDSALQLPVRGQADVAVYLDDQQAFAQKGLHAGELPRLIGPLPVRPGQRITLEVDFGAGRDLGDRVDWLMPMFLREPKGG